MGSGHSNTGGYVGENRKLDAGLRVKGFHEVLETNASAPTVQLRSIRVVLAVIAYIKWNSREMDVSMSFLRSGPLKRETYAGISNVVEKENVAWGLLKPMYGIITSREVGRKSSRDFLEEERGGEVEQSVKSVFFWVQQGFRYGYGGRFRDPDQTNMDKGILNVSENFETDEKRTAFGAIIDIQVDDLLISGSSELTDYISWEGDTRWIDMGEIKRLIWVCGLGIGRFGFRNHNSGTRQL